ncbi:MAG: phosphodiester glycosidase family protein [Cypionkella sp.]
MRLLVALTLLPLSVAAECRDIQFEAASYTVCDIAASQDLRLFQSGPDGPYGSFNAVESALSATGETLAFGMNAGMYHPNLKPVGLYIENGVEKTPIVTREGPGNFGLLPNGVFCIGADLRVIESLAYKAAPPACRYATQSGPMLVIDGALHPKFLANSDSLHIRNGVGASEDGKTAYFVISNQPVNFYDFARLFRDELHVKNALYLDGAISRLLAPQIGRMDTGFPMGPMLGLVVPRK